MSTRRLAGEDCGAKDCAGVFLTERGTVAVQGDFLASLGEIRPGPGEAIVEISLNMLLEAAREAR